ncbi:MAG TPA: protein kinase, partial [Bryobacteraceae bacterium]
MTLSAMSPQESIAHYRITGKLGQGGMGEVYRATDTKLGREVAVKVVPEIFVQDADRMARFAREAQVLASLNHPNIAAIYGVEDRALIIELVEGPTLEQRVAQGPIPVEEALPLALQIAEALEYAHERGVIHRDLKPANIKLAPDGRVKVLDFGLAKALASDPAAGDPASSPTLTMRATLAGVIMGTAGYMAPEQARGQNVDRRADIWAFGVVLYEMLCGRQAFTGDTVTDVLASVVKEELKLDGIPAGVRPVVERCLQKDFRKRWQAIGDARLEIERVLADPHGRGSPTASAPPPAPVPFWKRALVPAGAAVAAAAITGTVLWNLRPSAPAAPVARFILPLPKDQRFTNTGRALVAISPDGTNVAYVANRQLYLHALSETGAHSIPGTLLEGRGVLNPVFSPDGRWLAFWSLGDGTFKKIAITGGAAVTLCAATNPYGASWGADGIVFAQSDQGIMRVSANGGKPEVLVRIRDGESLAAPEALPGGHILFSSAPATGGAGRWEKAKITVQPAGSTQRKTVLDGGTHARYLSSGRLMYALNGSLFAVPFDLKRLETTGGPVPVIEGVRRGAGTGLAQFDFSIGGSLVYVPGPVAAVANDNILGIIARKGAVEVLKVPRGQYGYPRVSRDGKRIAFELTDNKETNIWIYELSGAS